MTNPATGAVLARVPLSSAADLDAAVRAAREALPAWRAVSVIERGRRLFALREGLDARREELARSVTLEMGKTLVDARAEVGRMIEMVECACAIPTTMQGRVLEDVARNVDAETVRQPVGVCAAIVPFNFPAMVPFWFLPFAIGCGNTFILKPSEQVPLTQQIAFEVLDGLDLPPGVVNLVNGGREVVEGILDHPGIDAVSFVGSAPVARLVYERAAQAGKRVQALGGAKNHMVVMPDAVIDETVDGHHRLGLRRRGAALHGRLGRRHRGRGPRPAAAAAVRGHRGAAGGRRARTSQATSGPVVSGAARDRIRAWIDRGVRRGRDARRRWARRGAASPAAPTSARPSSTTSGRRWTSRARRSSARCSRSSAPTPSTRRSTWSTAAASATARRSSPSRARRCGATATTSRPGMVGVNIGVAAPVAFFPFSGWKDSFLGDLHAHGPDAVEFYTRKKTVTSRYFSDGQGSGGYFVER